MSALAGAGFCCFAVLYVITISMLAASYIVVPPNTAGILLNSITQKMDFTRVYTSGRWYVGLGQSMVVFPLNAQLIDLDNVPVKSSNQDDIAMDVSVQYKIFNTEKGELKDIYTNYKTAAGHRNQLEAVLKTTLKDACSNFPTDRFFGRDSARPGATDVRAKLNEAIAAAIQNAFKSDKNFADAILIQVKDASYVKQSLNDQSIAIPVSLQLQKTKEYRQQKELVLKDKDSIVADAQAKVDVVLSTAKASGSNLVANAQAKGFTTVLEAFKGNYNALRTNLQLSGNSLMQYLYLKSIKARVPNSKIIAGFGNDAGYMRDALAAKN